MAAHAFDSGVRTSLVGMNTDTKTFYIRVSDTNPLGNGYQFQINGGSVSLLSIVGSSYTAIARYYMPSNSYVVQNVGTTTESIAGNSGINVALPIPEVNGFSAIGIIGITNNHANTFFVSRFNIGSGVVNATVINRTGTAGTVNIGFNLLYIRQV